MWVVGLFQGTACRQIGISYRRMFNLKVLNLRFMVYAVSVYGDGVSHNGVANMVVADVNGNAILECICFRF